MSGPPTDDDVVAEMEADRERLAYLHEHGPAFLAPAQAATIDPLRDKRVPKSWRWCQACGVMPNHPDTPQHCREGWIARDWDDPDKPCRLVMERPLSLHKHHLLPRSRGGGDGRNLILLCSCCHAEIHGLMKVIGL